MKLSPLSAPRAAAPAQSTISTCLSFWCSPCSCADVSVNMHCPSGLPRRIRARSKDSFVAAVTFVSGSQVWTFCEVACGQEVEFISSPCQAVPVLTRWRIPDHMTGLLPLSCSSNSGLHPLPQTQWQPLSLPAVLTKRGAHFVYRRFTLWDL